MFQSRAPQTLRLVRVFGGVGFEGENRKGFAVAPSYVEKKTDSKKGVPFGCWASCRSTATHLT